MTEFHEMQTRREELIAREGHWSRSVDVAAKGEAAKMAVFLLMLLQKGGSEFDA